MARRRGKDPELTLFPFLSVLAVVMGTLILVISGMSQLALANPKQRVEVEAFDPSKKTAIYVECTGDGLNIYPDDPTSGPPTLVPTGAIELAVSDWSRLLHRLEMASDTYYVMLLVRPEGVRAFELARNSVSPTAIEIGYEPLFESGEVRFENRSP